jgi:serine-type D-Ala-D-Ala endopeptidase (penicillin-binding protein 7)
MKSSSPLSFIVLLTLLFSVLQTSLAWSAVAKNRSANSDRRDQSTSKTSSKSQGASLRSPRSHAGRVTPVRAKHALNTSRHRNTPHFIKTGFSKNAHVKVRTAILGGQAVEATLAEAAFVIDPATGEEILARNADRVMPIASITKLMTALVVLDAGQPTDEILTVTRKDIDTIKGTSSRLPIGAKLSREEMLRIALMSSENRAASALGRHYPGGLAAFVIAMNAKARMLGMADTHYVEPTGLSSRNVSTARDLAMLVDAAYDYPLVREYSTYPEYELHVGRTAILYRNTNRLTRDPMWTIKLQKTGYISEAGRCVVMHTVVAGKPVIMVILHTNGKFSRAAEAKRIRQKLETGQSGELHLASRTRVPDDPLGAAIQTMTYPE